MSSFVIVNDPFPDEEQSIQVLHPPSPRALNFMAAGMAAALSSSIYNPLDCLKVRWQLLPAATASETSLISFGYNIVRTEGLVTGLWRPAVGVNAAGMGLSSGIRFACYEPFRNSLVGPEGEKDYRSHGAGWTSLWRGWLCSNNAVPFIENDYSSGARIDFETLLY
jgi:hypothetical protein